MAFINLDELDTVEPFADYAAALVHSENMSVATWQISAGSPFPEHSHPHEQIMIIIEGKFELTVEQETKLMRPGVVAVIPSGTSIPERP